MLPSDYSAMLPSHCHLFWLLKLANSVPPSAHYHGLQTEEATAAPSCAVTFQFGHAQSYQTELSYLVYRGLTCLQHHAWVPLPRKTWVSIAHVKGVHLFKEFSAPQLLARCLSGLCEHSCYLPLESFLPSKQGFCILYSRHYMQS